MIVVSDAGPLIHLARAEHFDLLSILFEEVVIPPSVFREVCEAGQGQWGADEVREALWICQQDPGDPQRVLALDAELGPGEADSIALAKQIHANLLLLDDARGRRVADHLGLAVRGTLGILAEGHRRGLVDDVEAAFSLLRARGTWVTDAVVERILGDLGLR